MSRVPNVSDAEKRPLHDAHGRFAKGNPGGGRTPLKPDLVRSLNDALVAEETFGLTCACACTTFRQHFIRRALVNDTVLIALANKLYPNAEESPDGKIINILYPPDWSRLGDALRVRTGSAGEALPTAPDATARI